MKIVTVNIPTAYIEAIERLVANDNNPDGIYPSRSELIRCAVREFLIKELTRTNEILKYKERREKELLEQKLEDIKEGVVRIPISTTDDNGKEIKSFKTYRIVKRLDYS